MRCMRCSPVHRPLQDVWVLAVLRIAIMIGLYLYTTPASASSSSSRRRWQQLSGGPLGPPTIPNHQQVCAFGHSSVCWCVCVCILFQCWTAVALLSCICKHTVCVGVRVSRFVQLTIQHDARCSGVCWHSADERGGRRQFRLS